MPTSSVSRSASPRRRGHTVLLRLFPALCVLLLGLIGLGCYLLVDNAVRQDATVAQHTERAVGRTFTRLDEEVARNLIDYSKWDEAFRRLHQELDPDWAYDQGNLGESLYRVYGYEGVLVFDGQDRPRYRLLAGQLVDPATPWLQGDIAGLLEAARSADARAGSVSGVLTVAGTPALVAAAAITPGDHAGVRPQEAPASVLVFVNVLSPARLAALSEANNLPPLSITTDPAGSRASWQLPGSGYQLTWRPPRPGLWLMQQTLPLFGGGVLILLLGLIWLFRQALLSMRQLDAQYDDLLASRSELAIGERRFRDIAEATSDWLWEVDATLRLVYVSDRFAEVTGEATERWLGRPLNELLTPHADTLAHWLAGQAHDRKPRPPLVCHYLDGNGRERTCRVAARAIPEGGYRGTVTDLTDEIEALAQVQHLSWHDPLTGLPNRHRLHQFLATHLEGPEPRPLALISLDLDRFKTVNDALGHAAGDQVLQEAAQRLRQNVTATDLVARLGGDEFCVVLSGDRDPGTIADLCRRLVEQLRQPFRLGEQRVFIGSSLGVALAPRDTGIPAELLRLADIALYQAKAAGRGTWRFHEPAMNEQVLLRRQLEQDLRQALRDDRLSLYYQPRRCLADGSLRGFEALVRWEHPTQGLLEPLDFLTLAEDAGLGQRLGRWVLETACHDAQGWPERLSVSVNLSPQQFHANEDPVQTVAEALYQSGLAASRLELELTERTLLDPAADVANTLGALKGLGVRLCLDDFGSGLCSLAYLRRYPLDGIRLDRSLIARHHQAPEDSALVRAMIDLGRSLGLRVTLKGVEDADHLRQLQHLPADEIQGFHCGAPLPADRLDAWLDELATESLS
ncbi:bifunctional diguanylate cyclase/phosphodiesterase [Pseudomonas sp. PS02302]|uniref:bifunctional diguanylate cyclase/phosphodiesterase n=1 Tax=Pseudomonas sp. PS02302 TaxID=2991428 RepID=UPI00249C8999|nr:EAL domain-containing protein [Pseudomonas sp. PS02302]